MLLLLTIMVTMTLTMMLMMLLIMTLTMMLKMLLIMTTMAKVREIFKQQKPAPDIERLHPAELVGTFSRYK